MDGSAGRDSRREEVSKVYPPPEVRTSDAELLGTTTGMILTAVVAIVGLAVLLGVVFLAGGQPDTRRLKVRRRGGISGSAPTGEISAGQGHRPWEQIEDRHVPEGGHPHGKPASWVLVAGVIAAFITGGAAVITHAWWLLWACIAIVALAVPAGKVIGIMDDTVAWGSTPAANPDPPQGPEDDRGQDQPAPARLR
jgi:hypothetical protein